MRRDSVPDQARRAVDAVRADEAGISLVEVLVAIFVLGVVLTGFAATTMASIISVDISEDRQQAYTAATRAIEAARGLRHDQLALATSGSAFASSSFDPFHGTPDDPGTLEPVIRRDQEDHRFESETFQRDDEIELRTIPTVPAGQDPANPDQVRVTAIARFVSRGQVEYSRQTTLVDRRVSYGVEQPSFSITPVIGTLRMERDQRQCIDHTVTNLGSPEVTDRYRLHPPEPGAVPELAADFGLQIFEVLSSGTEIPHTGWTEPHAIDESAVIRVCYTSRAHAESVADVPLVARSEVTERLLAEDTTLTDDEREERREERSQTVFHNVEIELERRLFLSDELAGAGRRILTVDPPPAGAGAEAASGRWFSSFGSPRTVRSATLHIAARTTAPPDEDQPVRPIEITAVLMRRSSDATTVMATTTWSVLAHPDTWTPQERPLPVTVGALETGDELELELACSAPAGQTCLLGYGSAGLPSRVEVRFP